MPLAMLVAMVGMLVSTALVPVVVNQIGGTRIVSGRTQELQVAQAGIDMALGQLRAAATAGAGDLEKLPPCTLTGAGTDGWNYRVTITYYQLGEDASDPVPQACPPIYVPVSATLTATGGRAPAASLTVGSAGSRTIESTYTFHTNNENITGGALQLASPTTNPLCMDAGADSSPAAGAPLKVQLCKAGGSSDQRFAYTADLNIKLVGSETAAAPEGMCVDVPYPRATGDAAVFQPCLGLAPRQQWSLNDSSNFSSTRETTVKLGDFCLALKVAGTAGTPIVLGSCGGTANQNIFRPQPGVGAGMASAKVNQLVNFKQFSRCLDVTNFTPTFSYMIVWFCKQSPDGNVPWNQKWYMPAQAASVATAVPGQIRSGNPTAPAYCLLSPGSTATTKYVTMARCDSTDAATIAAMKWTVLGDTGEYTTSYRIVDSFGYCLTPTDLTVTNPDTHTDGTAKVKVAACSKAELQKWNAPANLNQPLALTNTREK
ncbi:hypothetical protein GCM10020358_64360 [Amorphoplanes nipponensis]|uniref:Ricin B lectin domain-containing protein n=2 Tax=Actinoplanes nipponensis TaxID=135950 RepID=A0A919MJT8_9ACTN|nr:hypothetical protein Ani05nite_56930 [Actinoplanes nipponensis]